jgi:hypothetical protein
LGHLSSLHDIEIAAARNAASCAQPLRCGGEHDISPHIASQYFRSGEF